VTADAGAAPDRLTAALDAFAEHTGRLISWLTLAMVVATVVVVVLRYAAGVGLIWLQESVNWMHSIVFLLGAAYTLKSDEHVRVDVFYRGMSERGRAIVDLTGTAVLLLPLCAFLIVESWPYVASSWQVSERSREAGGLPMLYLLKSVIPLMAGLLALQGFAVALRCIAKLRSRAGS